MRKVINAIFFYAQDKKKDAEVQNIQLSTMLINRPSKEYRFTFRYAINVETHFTIFFKMCSQN